MTRALAPFAIYCLAFGALITIQVLATRYRRKREDQAAARFERQVAQALAACRADDEFRAIIEREFGARYQTPRRPQ